MRVQYLKCAYGPYYKLNSIQNGVYILEEVSFYILKVLTLQQCSDLHILGDDPCKHGLQQLSWWNYHNDIDNLF